MQKREENMRVNEFDGKPQKKLKLQSMYKIMDCLLKWWQHIYSNQQTDQLLTHDHTNHDQASGQPMDCRLGKHFAREPKENGARRIELWIPSGNIGRHVLSSVFK